MSVISIRSRLVAVLAALVFISPFLHASEPKWIRIDSSHFSVLTNAEEKRGHDTAVRFEQMRAEFGQLLLKSRLNWSKPIAIVAVRSTDEFSRLCPTRADENIARGGFLLASSDPAYIVLDLSREDSWRAVAADFARLLLTYNYPPTQAWFDEGFADYFSSLRLDATQMQIGADPQGPAPNRSSEAGKSSAVPNSRGAFTDVLSTSAWMSIPDLFNASATKPTAIFRSESWIVIRYLLDKNKLPETGTYFGLVENEKAPVEDAIQRAYGMSSAQFEQAVTDYFHATFAAPASTGRLGENSSPAPVLAETVGSSTHDVAPSEARSLLAEISLRLPEHREQAKKELETIVADPKSDNPAAHRALGWYYMETKEFEQANDELDQASNADLKDPWSRYYAAQVKFRESEVSGHGFKGLANMMQDLHAVLDWDPEFAEAYSLLSRAQVEGGGLHAAMDSARAAIRLSPRNQAYVLQMAEVYMAAKNFDAANHLLEQLTSSSDAQVAKTARTYLHDLPMLRKYGIPPQHEAEQAQERPAPTPPHGPSQPVATAQNKPEERQEAEDEQVPSEPPLDKRAIQYAKGTLVGIDCTQAPAAVLTISSAGKILKLRTPDYKSLTLIGADSFSCDWAHRAVAANYKAKSKTEGDLVSLELH